MHTLLLQEPAAVDDATFGQLLERCEKRLPEGFDFRV
jgi:hypothetical protein